MTLYRQIFLFVVTINMFLETITKVYENCLFTTLTNESKIIELLLKLSCHQKSRGGLLYSYFQTFSLDTLA